MALLAAEGATFLKDQHLVNLRKWQADATYAAVVSFKKGRRLWVTEACTGAGKTRHGCEVGLQLLKSGDVDQIIVLTPTVATKNSWKAGLGRLGNTVRATDDTAFPEDTNAWVSTYSGFGAVKAGLESHRVLKGILLIVDEYHHAEEDATWGTAVASLGSLAKHVIFLSGTPWRQSGSIPMLSGATNANENSYYEEGSSRVRADFVHDYKTDLRSGNDRATTLVSFELYESIFTDKNTNKKELLSKPDFDLMSEAEAAKWEEEATSCSIPLGKHVRISGPTLTGNDLAKKIIEWCVQKLQKSRSETFLRCQMSDLTIMLVVAQSVKEARYLSDYIQEVYALRTEVIVSENAGSNERLEVVRQKCAENATDKPDVIVSVGMISEGVDIPQIKVIAYLSAVLTTLYLVQVIGRALRRMSISSDRFADSNLHDTLAYVAAPAHPKICYVARSIEEQMQEAAKAKGGDGGEGPDRPKPEPVTGTVETTDDVLSILRGQENGLKWREVVEQMKNHPSAQECFLDASWCDYVLGLALRGTEEASKKAQQLATEMCECLGIEFPRIWSHIAKAGDNPLSYDQEQKLLRKQAQYLTNIVRWKCSPFSEIESNDDAFMRVRSYLNKKAGIRVGFAKASLDQKRVWINCAEQLIKGGKADEQL